MKLTAPQTALRQKASSKRASTSTWFFKTGPGEYGEGDLFIGVTVPQIREVAKAFRGLDLPTVQTLLQSRIHEDRLLGLIIMTDLFSRAKELKDKKKVFDFYLKNRLGINNWDLVDVSAAKIVGEYARLSGDVTPIRKLSRSKRHWDRRIAMVSTYAFIRQKDPGLAFEMAEVFLPEVEDLMHKASGWMLREAGKRDLEGLREFISTHGRRMPRTMLRYSIERFSAGERARILKETRSEKATKKKLRRS